MTGEEQQQVQNLINARAKLLTEKISRQEEQIKTLNDAITTLNAEIESRNEEITSLKVQLTEAQEQSRKLLAIVQQTNTPQVVPPEPKKPGYLVSLLRQHFGFDEFRAGQEEVIDALLSGRDVFCSMPDGYGKSLCYRLPALLMPGLTLVITPETPKVKTHDAHSEILTPSISPTKRREVLRKIKNGTCKILYASLDDLKSDDIINALKAAELSMTAIIALWAEYDGLKDYRDFVKSLNTRRTPVGIFADSTSPNSRNDLMKLADLHSPLKVVAGFEREGITYKVIRTEHKDEALNEIIAQKKDIAGVIYTATPEEAYKLREKFRDERIIIMPRKIYREISGHDMKYIIHYEIPETPADYSQEITCAGQKAECFILASRNDIRNADRTLTRFFEDKKPGEYLLSYLGASPEKLPVQEAQKFLPEDFSDFDFGNANEAQKEAITNTNGPLLIIAGPGTGKTFTLVQRAVFLIQKRRVKPENIMLATFTDKAAQELTARITEELSLRNIHADTGAMYTGTFHVICERVLNEYIEFTAFKRNFRILDEFGHSYTIMQNMKKFEEIPGINDVFMTQGRWNRAKELRDYINALSEELADPEELMKDKAPAVSALGRAMKVHDDMLAANNALSWSALLVETYKLLRDNPEILDDLTSRIRYIMIDEYQDTNYVQEQLIFLIAGEGKNICVVGDDDQSLYRFRGATVRNILEFPDKFAKNECRIVRLMLNYRSTPGIIKFFGEWMSDTSRFFTWDNFRHPKKIEPYREAKSYPSVFRLAGLNDRDDWHEKILSFIRSLKVDDYNQIAFLFRSVKAKAVQELSQFLENNNINVYSPRSNMFFRRPEIHFALGCLISMFPKYLKALEAGEFRFNGTEPEYITYYRNCLKNVARYIDKPAYSDLKKWLMGKRAFHEKLDGYTNYTYSDLLYELFAFLPFNHALDVDMNDTAKAQRPARNLARLAKILRDYEHNYNINNLHSKYIAQQFTMMMNIYMKFQIDEGLDEYESDTENIPSGHVAFMTIHQAKGAQFPVVFVDSLWAFPDTNIQRDRNTELMRNIQESYSRRPEFEPYDSIKFFDFWRLYYVAFSRARDLLILTCKEDANTPSKYLEGAYNTLDDADEVFSPAEAEITQSAGAGAKHTYSFTGDILTYETCPTQYKFLRELEFSPRVSQSTFMGTLIHATIEDIHRAALNHEENRITEQNISEWFRENYEHLSRTHQAYLSRAGREAALSQVMNYVRHQGSDWSAVFRAENEAKALRENYILEGKIDLITMRDGGTEITDFKSGPKPNININRDRELLETYRRQLNVYAYLVEKSSGLKVSRMKLYYTGENTNAPEITYTYNPEEAENIMNGFDDTVAKIVSRDFSAKAKDPEICRECDFRFYCGRGN